MPDTQAVTPVQGSSSLIEELQTPISEANPCGSDVTYDDAFQQVMHEVDKASTVSGRIDHEKVGEGGSIFSGGETDYKRIVEISREILRSKSKDLRVASYLTVGLYQTQGLAGMAEGLSALNVLVETFWEDLYPPKRRARARKSAIELLVGRLKGALTTYKPTQEEREQLEQALAAAEKLQAFLMAELQEHAPAMSGLTSALTECLRRVKAPEPAEAPEKKAEPVPEKKAEPVPEKKAGPAPRSVQRVVLSDVEAPRELKSTTDAEQVVFEASAFLRSKDNTNPVPYRLNRMLRWGALREEPPHQDGKTPFQPPLPQRLDYLTGLKEKGDFAELIEAAEVAFQEPPFHFWLDLQRLFVAATDALGAPFQHVRNAVLEEVALLVRRFPGLTTLAFSDSTPFTDSLTLDWIDSHVTPIFQTGEEAETISIVHQAGGTHLEEQYATAQQRLSAGELSGALAVLQHGSEQDASQRDRFLRRFYLALLCLKGGQQGIACPVLESLDEEMSHRALDEWDPALALQVWSSLYRCYQALNRGLSKSEKQAMQERAGNVFEKICRLNAQYALTIAGKGKR